MATISINSTRRLADIEVGVEGQSLFSPCELSVHKVVDETAGLKPGRAVVRGADADRDAALPTALVADAEAIEAQNAALGDASGTTYTFSGLNPPAPITITQDAAANWDATTAVVEGLGLNGTPLREELALTDAGDDVISTTGKFISGTVTIPAQTGDAPGSIGTGADAGPLEILGFTQKQPQSLANYAAGSNVTTEAEPIPDNHDVKIVRQGRMYVRCEDAATAGGLVYVRCVASGAEELGTVRATPDGTAGAPDALLAVTNGGTWRFVTSSTTADQIVVIERI